MEGPVILRVNKPSNKKDRTLELSVNNSNDGSLGIWLEDPKWHRYSYMNIRFDLTDINANSAKVESKLIMNHSWLHIPPGSPTHLWEFKEGEISIILKIFIKGNKLEVTFPFKKVSIFNQHKEEVFQSEIDLKLGEKIVRAYRKKDISHIEWYHDLRNWNR